MSHAKRIWANQFLLAQVLKDLFNGPGGRQAALLLRETIYRTNSSVSSDLTRMIDAEIARFRIFNPDTHEATNESAASNEPDPLG